MLSADLLSLHLVTFLMFFILVVNKVIISIHMLPAATLWCVDNTIMPSYRWLSAKVCSVWHWLIAFQSSWINSISITTSIIEKLMSLFITWWSFSDEYWAVEKWSGLTLISSTGNCIILHEHMVRNVKFKLSATPETHFRIEYCQVMFAG